MTIKSKVKLVIEGIVIPYLVYFLSALFISFVFTMRYGKENINLVLIQGISNFVSLFILIPLYIRFINKYCVTQDGFNIKKSLYLIPIALSSCIILNIIVDFIPREYENFVTESVIKLANEYNPLLSLIIISVIVPIIEELLFRGFFYDTVKALSNDIIAIIFTSLTFAIAHIDFRQMIYAFLAGFILGYIKFKFKNIKYNIILHLLFNFISFYFVSSIINQSLMDKIYTIFIMGSLLFFTFYRLKKV